METTDRIDNKLDLNAKNRLKDAQILNPPQLMKKILFLAFSSFAAVHAHASLLQSYDLRGVGGFGLLPSNEPGSILGGTGGEIGAGIFLDDNNDADPNTNTLFVNVGWGSSQGFTDLSSASSNSHIHGPTAAINGSGFTQTAGVLFNFTRSSNLATGGIFTAPSNAVSLSSAQVTQLNDGKFYINLHTTTNTGGEARGFIVQAVPEPSTAILAGVGVLGLLGRRRRPVA